MKPVIRSKARKIVGKALFTYTRYYEWLFSKHIYSKERNFSLLPHNIASHKSPLLRELKGVDMWLQYNKITNLKISIKKLNGIIINPGETFSFWKLIGNPSKKRGYVQGLVLDSGRFRQGIGGGLCQLTNLIYWMTLHTPLTITERYRHSYDVFPDSNRTQPFGSGATCVYNYRDLMIYNNTNQKFQLNIYLDNNYLQGKWYSEGNIEHTYQVYQKKHWITNEFWGGYIRHNIIHRKLYDKSNNYISDEFVTENHAIMMYQPYLCEPYI